MIVPSVAAAAAENDGFVVGVDVDQSGESDTVVTSAMKGLKEATEWAIGKFYAGEWASIANVDISLGVENDAVGLPTAADSWRFETYTAEQYAASLEAVKTGALVVNSDAPVEGEIVNAELPNVNVDYI